MSRRDRELLRAYFLGVGSGIFLALILHALLPEDAHAAPRVASYAKQTSGGSPLLVEPNVEYLARFDDATLEMVPWAQGVDGRPRSDVPLRLRALNPNIRLWMYALVGDFWLPPSYQPQSWDHSAYRDVFDAINAGNGWLYGTDGRLWWGERDYRVNLADSATVRRLGDVYVRLVSLHLFDGVFLDWCSTSIAWESKPERPLDVERAGFRSLAAMDSARLANVELLIRRLHAVNPCLLVAVNGTGPKPAGCDVDFREGLGTLISPTQAATWLRTPGTHWLKGECYTDADCAYKASLLRGLATYGRSVIVSLGPDRGWEPVEVKP